MTREKKHSIAEPSPEERKLKAELTTAREEYGKEFRHVAVDRKSKQMFRQQHTFRKREDEYIAKHSNSKLADVRAVYEKKLTEYLEEVSRSRPHEYEYEKRLEAITLINTKLRWRAVAVMGRVIVAVVKPIVENERVRAVGRKTIEWATKHPYLASLGILVVAGGVFVALPTTWLAAVGIGAGTGISYRIMGGRDVEDYLRGKKGKKMSEQERVEYAARHQRNTKVQASLLAFTFGGIARALRTALASELGIDRAESIVRKWLGQLSDSMSTFAEESLSMKASAAPMPHADPFQSASVHAFPEGQSAGNHMHVEEVSYRFGGEEIPPLKPLNNRFDSIVAAYEAARKKWSALLADGVETLRDINIGTYYEQYYWDLQEKMAALRNAYSWLDTIQDSERLYNQDPQAYISQKLYVKYGLLLPDKIQSTKASVLADIRRLTPEVKNLLSKVENLQRQIASLPVFPKGIQPAGDMRPMNFVQPEAGAHQSTVGFEQTVASSGTDAPPHLGQGELIPSAKISPENVQAVVEAVILHERGELDQTTEAIMKFIDDFSQIRIDKNSNPGAYAEWYTAYQSLIKYMIGLGELRGGYNQLLDDVMTASDKGGMTVADVMERVKVIHANEADYIQSAKEFMRTLRIKYPSHMLGSEVLASYDGGAKTGENEAVFQNVSEVSNSELLSQNVPDFKSYDEFQTFIRNYADVVKARIGTQFALTDVTLDGGASRVVTDSARDAMAKQMTAAIKNIDEVVSRATRIADSYPALSEKDNLARLKKFAEEIVKGINAYEGSAYAETLGS